MLFPEAHLSTAPYCFTIWFQTASVWLILSQTSNRWSRSKTISCSQQSLVLKRNGSSNLALELNKWYNSFAWTWKKAHLVFFYSLFCTVIFKLVIITILELLMKTFVQLHLNDWSIIIIWWLWLWVLSGKLGMCPSICTNIAIALSVLTYRSSWK